MLFLLRSLLQPHISAHQFLFAFSFLHFEACKNETYLFGLKNFFYIIVYYFIWNIRIEINATSCRLKCLTFRSNSDCVRILVNIWRWCKSSMTRIISFNFLEEKIIGQWFFQILYENNLLKWYSRSTHETVGKLYSSEKLLLQIKTTYAQRPIWKILYLLWELLTIENNEH